VRQKYAFSATNGSSYLSKTPSQIARCRFHQILFARQKVTGAQSLAKIFAIQFHQHSASNCADEIRQICEVKFAKLICHLPNAIRKKTSNLV